MLLSISVGILAFGLWLRFNRQSRPDKPSISD